MAWFKMTKAAGGRRAAADTARHGYSSQRMSIWNAAGEPIAEAMQGVAIFG